jgi:Tol biopolymer transport system component/predicted Ser/Thr protein kinase
MAATMKLDSGSRLAHYEIIELIGKGGMGDVYRATDKRLSREVAIKTSGQQFSERFAREASVIASLNHPNICTLFDVGPDYLVMEMIEGPTLSERIKNGAMNLEETTSIMRQVADAVEYAHERGVVHRDLKPGNIKIRPDGVVKVLDFGLAKVTAGTPSSNGADVPTVAAATTAAGVVLGTTAYMSPEQALGKPVDKRADVWSYGVVFYEMLTGSRMHKGDSAQEIMAAVLKDEPDLTKVPPQAHRLLKRCLEKDPNKRLRHIGDVIALLDEPPSGSQSAVAAQPKAAKKRWLWPAIAAGILAAGVILAIWTPWRTSTGHAQAVRFEVGPAEGMTFNAGAAMSVSPNGRWMVFPATGSDNATRYWLRSLDGVDVRALPGTETGPLAAPAAWSFDSRWVLFAINNKLQKIDIQGGPPQPIADFPSGLNGAGWSSAGVIVAGTAAAGNPIFRIPASGGVATPITALASGESGHAWPQLLPDEKHFLYERISSDPARMGVYVGSIEAKPEEQSNERLLASDRQAYYAPSPDGVAGHLIFLRKTTLMAQTFDPNKLTLSGEPVAIANGIDSYANRNYGLFSVSNTGTLVYREGAGVQSMLSWFDRMGNPAGTIGDAGDYAFPAVSFQGDRIAVAVGPQASRKIAILDVTRGTTTPFTFDPAHDDFPVWSPDGKNIVFVSDRGGQSDLYIKPSDGSGMEQILFKSSEPKISERWSKDGRFLLFTSTGSATAQDIWTLPMQGDSKPIALVNTKFPETQPRLSPDGHWLAYLTLESGSPQIYVTPFAPDAGPGSGAKWLISKGGGLRPLWGPDGKELFYLTLNLQVMAVDIDTSKGFQAGTPHRLFTASPLVIQAGWDFDAVRKRFLMATPPGSGRVIPFTVVLNWATDLKN